MSQFSKPALVAGAVSALALTLAPSALAAPPMPTQLNPPPLPFLTCKVVGTGTICSGTRHLVEQPIDTGIVCGTGPSAFDIFDQGEFDQRATRWYDPDGNLTRRVIHERWTPAWWSNPLTGATLPYTQTNTLTTVLAVPGDFGTATETTVGEVIFTDPATHKKVLGGVGRTVIGADGTVQFSAGQQPLLKGNVDPMCAALAS